MKIVVAGASGFIGLAFLESGLKLENIEWVGLSRRERESSHPRLTWKKCDLFSMKDLDTALKDCDQAVYLVHSMLPSAELSQGSFYDFDLLLADNFARMAKKNGVKHITYLGGMIPVDTKLSWHLKSRFEVEEVLRGTGIPTTTLRAGLIIGKNGSSFEILHRLVHRLPLLICPTWTLTESQPVALVDMVKVLTRIIETPSIQGRIYDIGGPEILTYQKLLQKTASAMGRSARVISFNFIPLRFSRLWVRLITGVSKDLVYPLVLSLKHRMVASSKHLWPYPEDLKTPIANALREAIQGSEKKLPVVNAPLRFPKEVRSIQRLELPAGRNAEWVVEQYLAELPNFFGFFIKVIREGDFCKFLLFTKKWPLLILQKSKERSSPDRQLLYIRGGLLASKTERGRLEFRVVLNERFVIAAIHEYKPRLPWNIYRYTQALVHLWFMKLFERKLPVLANPKE